MSIFRKSLGDLAEERDSLQAVIDAKASELTAKRADPGYLVSQLVPFTTKMQHIKREIRDRTPLAELEKKLAQLRESIQELPAGGNSNLSHLPLDEVGAQLQLRNRRMELESEAMEIDNYLKFTRRREALTWKSALVFIAVVAAIVVLPNLIGRWLAP